MNNYERAKLYIEQCGSLTPSCCCFGPTGPTERLVKSSNRNY